MTISVFLVDDHRILREGLALLLQSQSDIRVVGEAEDGREAVGKILAARPDVVLMDITMPELNGIEAARQIRSESPSTKIIILSVHSDSEHVFQVFQAGVQGYLLKESAGSEVVKAVREMETGDKVRVATYGHAGDGNLHVTIMYRKRNFDELREAHELLEEVYKKTVAMNGRLTGEHGVGLTVKDYLGLHTSVEELGIMKRIKAAFDPKGLLNPGKIFPDA